MIPPDLATSVRLLTQSGAVDHQTGVEGVNNVRELQARLPQLLPGQQFSATIQRAFSDGTFQAIVAGRNLTLALSQSAQPGDVLSLVATEVKGNTVLARPADVVADAQVSGQTNLSNTGRLISTLLTGQNAAGPTQLAGGSPLVASPPADAGAARQMLAPALQQALTQSGLFYESHQEKWLAGKVQVADMLMEPQGKLSAMLQQGRVPVLTQPAGAAAATPGAAGAANAASASATAAAANAANAANATLTATLAAAKAAPAASPAAAAGLAAGASANSAVNAAYSASVLAGLFADPQLVAGATGQTQEAGLLNELAKNLDLVMRTLQNGQGESAAGKAPGAQQAAEGGKAQQTQQAAREAAQMLKNAAAEGGEELKNVARETARANASEAQQQAASAQQAAARQVIPERLVPIVHQQLESLATQNYLMQGMAWPGQKFEWEVEDDGHAAHGEEGELQEWKTTLRVIMPNMGGVEARIALTASGVSLRLVAEYDDTVDKLTQASAELAEALEAADVPLTGFIAEKVKEKPAPEEMLEEGSDG